MKTATIEVGDLISPRGARGVEQQPARLPGVQRVEASHATASATVIYDERVIDLKAIKARVREGGYHCRGILINNAQALEEATKPQVLIFDKTGTLTLGKPEVVDVAAAPDEHLTTSWRSPCRAARCWWP
jgi:cation transport ATPase